MFASDKQNDNLMKLEINALVPYYIFKNIKQDRYVHRIYITELIPVEEFLLQVEAKPYFEPCYIDLEFKFERWRDGDGPITYWWSLKSKKMNVPKDSKDQVLKTIACITNYDGCQVCFNPRSEQALSIVDKIKELLEQYNLGTNVTFKPSLFVPMDYVLANGGTGIDNAYTRSL